VGLYSGWLIFGGGGYIWNEVSVSTCGGLIHGGLYSGGVIFGGLRYANILNINPLYFLSKDGLIKPIILKK
jgi:hypothetical protein